MWNVQVRYGGVRKGRSGGVRSGAAWYGWVSFGVAGLVRSGWVRYGGARTEWYGGVVAQSAECCPVKAEVTGSNPVSPADERW